MKCQKLNSKIWLIEQYINKNRGMRYIAKKCQCTVGRVSRRLRSYNIPIKSYTDGKRRVLKGKKHPNYKSGFFVTRTRNTLLWKEGWLRNKYLVEKMTLSSIADLVGSTEGAVRYALDKLGIERRRYTMSKIALASRKKGAMSKKPRYNTNGG